MYIQTRTSLDKRGRQLSRFNQDILGFISRDCATAVMRGSRARQPLLSLRGLVRLPGPRIRSASQPEAIPGSSHERCPSLREVHHVFHPNSRQPDRAQRRVPGHAAGSRLSEPIRARPRFTIGMNGNSTRGSSRSTAISGSPSRSGRQRMTSRASTSNWVSTAIVVLDVDKMFIWQNTKKSRQPAAGKNRRNS